LIPVIIFLMHLIHLIRLIRLIRTLWRSFLYRYLGFVAGIFGSCRSERSVTLKTPGVNFINILPESFLYENASRSFSLVMFWQKKHFHMKKARVKHWWNWHQIHSTPWRRQWRLGPQDSGLYKDSSTKSL